MISWLWLMFLWICASVLGLFLYQDPGYIFIRWHQWTLEMTCWTGFCTIMLGYASLRLSLSCAQKIMHHTQKIYYQYKEKYASKQMAQDISPEGYWILGQLFEHMKEKTKATRAYREGFKKLLSSRHHH